MANRHLRAPQPLFPTASASGGSSTTNFPPSTSHGSSAHVYPTNNPTPSHTQIWLSSSHKLTQLESAHTLTADEPSVFGPAHAKALEDLRTAQIQLAQAWMRGETEDRDALDGEHAELAKQSFGRDGDLGGRGGSGGGAGGAEDATGGGKDAGSERVGGELPIPGTAANAAMHGLGGFGGTSAGSGSSRAEGGMERDVLLAKRRRELNDEHFKRVSMSVMDVIQKLENVAAQMGVVESESRDIWGGSEMSDGSSMK